MAKIRIGFKAFDPHELLCHFVAEYSGLYKRENIEVELLDITFMDDVALAPEVCQASCGAALASALKGSLQKVIFVATEQPMFWIYARAEIDSLAALKNARLATFPAIAPPHHLANMILVKAGLLLTEDIQLLPARDDVARLGLLKSAQVDAAVISSAIAPAKIEELGMNNLCFFGNEIRIPTTGLAAHQQYLDKEAELLRVVRGILKQSLHIIENNHSVVASVLTKVFDVAPSHSEQTAALLSPCFTKDGKVAQAVAENAIAGLAKSLSISQPPDWQEIYRFD